MPKVDLKRVYNLEGENGAVQSFGPGKTEVPDWAHKQLKERGVIAAELTKGEAPPQDVRPS